MTDMPKRVIAIIDYDGEADGKFCDADMPVSPIFDGGVEYIRADEAAAMVANALAENCGGSMRKAFK